MKSHQFRAILDWRMCSDPFPQGVDMDTIDEWIAEVSREFGFQDWADAFHCLQVDAELVRAIADRAPTPSQPVDTKLLILALDLLHSDMKKVNRDYDVEHLIHQVLAIKSNINGMFAYSEQHTKEVKRLEEDEHTQALRMVAHVAAKMMQQKCFAIAKEHQGKICAIHFPPIIEAAVNSVALSHKEEAE